jgi:GPI-anchor transamidase subunit K
MFARCCARFMLLFVVGLCLSETKSLETNIRSARKRKHTSNYAVIVSTSRYWFNYRHNANALAVYHAVKRMGIPDENIILMLPDDQACDARNDRRAQMFNHERKDINLYEDIEVDYRGTDVNVERFLQVLRGRHHRHTPKNQRMDSDEHSNILIYMTGHGGDEFLKFQDSTEISSQDFADAFDEMFEKRRYNEILFVTDTCQAGTLGNLVRSPGIVSVGSSLKGENSYSWSNDDEIGLTLTDRFTRATMLFFERITLNFDGSSNLSLHDWISSLQRSNLRSNVGVNTANYNRRLKDVSVTEFFGSTVDVFPTFQSY